MPRRPMWTGLALGALRAREVEVARRDDGGQLAPEDGRVRGGTAPEQPIEETPGWWGGRRRRGRGQDREADVLEGPPMMLEQMTCVVRPLPNWSARRRKRRGIKLTGKK